jgi:hypothetical protein
MVGNIGINAFYNCYRLGESNPGMTVIFADSVNLFIHVETWSGMGTSGGRGKVSTNVKLSRLQFKNRESGNPISLD